MTYSYRLDNFFEYLYSNQIKNTKSREYLSKITGIDKLKGIAETENHNVSVSVVGEEIHEGHHIRHLAMEILPHLVMPVCIVYPNTDKHKNILYCHGHGTGGFYASLTQKGAYHKNIPLVLAERGYTTFMFEPVGFGDFKLENYIYNENQSLCYPLTTNLSLYGITTVGLRAYQAYCLGIYMLEQGYGNFSTLGISGGGACMAIFGALFNIHAANVICSYANTFKQSIMHMSHCVDNFIPDIMTVGEMPDILELCAPKKLFISGGKQDKIFPVEATEIAIKHLSTVYARHNASENLGYELFDGGHEFSTGFIDWLDAHVYCKYHLQ